jgi:mycothiol synthase
VVHTSFAEHFGRAEGRTYEQWYDAWHRREDLDLSLWWVAEVDATPAAVLLGMTYPDCGHVGTLGTLKEFRGRGLGTTLLRTSFAEFHRRGLRKVTLGVDASNETGAVRLYESVGMAPTTDWVCYELGTG